MTRQEASLPQAPPYTDVEAPLDDWIQGKYEASRTVMLVYNPNPSGGTVNLDERSTGFVAGVGMYEITLKSDIVSEIAG